MVFILERWLTLSRDLRLIHFALRVYRNSHSKQAITSEALSTATWDGERTPATLLWRKRTRAAAVTELAADNCITASSHGSSRRHHRCI